MKDRQSCGTDVLNYFFYIYHKSLNFGSVSDAKKVKGCRVSSPTRIASAERMIFYVLLSIDWTIVKSFQVMCPYSFDVAIGAKCEKKIGSGNEKNLVSFGLVLSFYISL